MAGSNTESLCGQSRWHLCGDPRRTGTPLWNDNRKRLTSIYPKPEYFKSVVIAHLGLSSVTTRFTKDRKSQQKFMHTVGFQQLYSFCLKMYRKLMKCAHGVLPDVFKSRVIYCFTLMRWEILEMWKVSMETTTPSWSRKPATTLGTPGRKDWAHHLSSLNLRSAKIKALPSSQSRNMRIMRLYFILYLWKLLRCLGVQISAEVFSST